MSDADFTILMAASYWGREEIVKALIAKGADLNSRDKDGWTALDFAQGNNHPKVVELLISKGAKTRDQLAQEIKN